MFAFLKGLFSTDKIVDTTTGIIEKIAGTDWTSKDKAEFLLNYMDTTKQQSPARRFIAIGMTLFYMLVGFGWCVSTVVGNVLHEPAALTVAAEYRAFLKDVLSEPMNYIIMFYFGIAAVQAIKK